MGVVTPERPVAPEELPPRRRFPTSLAVLAAVLLSGYLFIAWVSDLIPDVANPFTTETVDRTGPAVLKSIQNLQDFRAASGHFEVIVDVERETRFVPDVIRGQRVLFVAIGSVDAGDLPRAGAGPRAQLRLRPRPRCDRPDPVAPR